MYDNVYELLETCQDLLTICQKLILAERDINREEVRTLKDKLANIEVNEKLGVFKNV